MSESTIVRVSLEKRKKGKTDWAGVDRMSDADIGAALATDPDWAGAEAIDWSQAEVVALTAKQAISIRLDNDVLDFFKEDGPGYQKRINAVLRAYMSERLKRA